MFVAMNRFKVVTGREADFERTWRERETYLQGVAAVVVLIRDQTLMVLPVHHATAGGCLLKQRNAALKTQPEISAFLPARFWEFSPANAI